MARGLSGPIELGVVKESFCEAVKEVFMWRKEEMKPSGRGSIALFFDNK